jgi:amino acid permease
MGSGAEMLICDACARLPGYATRYLDPAIGFALGWNYLFKYLIVTPNNIVAGVVAIQCVPPPARRGCLLRIG